MKAFTISLVLILMAAFIPLNAADYILTINGQAQEIELDKETTRAMKDGTSLKVLLHQKDYLTFSADLFSFEHKNEFKPNRNDLGDGIFQTMVVTPLGTGILIQEYMDLDPSGLVDMMIKELTKEEINYGYEYSEKPAEKKVDGVTFTGKTAVTTYRGDEWTRSVLVHNGRDQGILVVTFIEKANYQAEKDLIDHLWKSVKVTLKK